MSGFKTFVPDYNNLDWSIGFALEEFEQVHITVDALASLIRYQCLNIDCTWDIKALDEIAKHGKHKFIVIKSISEGK